MFKKLSVLLFIPLIALSLVVPASAVYEPLYAFNVPKTFDKNNCLDTGVSLFDTDKSFTVCIKFNPLTVSGSVPFECGRLSVSDQGGHFQVVNANSRLYQIGYGTDVLYSLCLSRSAGSSVLYAYYISPQSDVVAVHEIPFTFSMYQSSSSATVGSWFSGTIYDFAIYDFAFDQTQASDYLVKGVVSPPAFSNEFNFLFVLLIGLILLFAIFVFVR